MKAYPIFLLALLPSVAAAQTENTQAAMRFENARTGVFEAQAQTSQALPQYSVRQSATTDGGSSVLVTTNLSGAANSEASATSVANKTRALLDAIANPAQDYPVINRREGDHPEWGHFHETTQQDVNTGHAILMVFSEGVKPMPEPEQQPVAATEGSTATSAETLTESLSLFPNPLHTSATVVIDYPSLKDQKLEFVLTSLDGRQAFQTGGLTSTQTFTLQRGDLTPGVYVYSLRSPQGAISTGRLMVE